MNLFKVEVAYVYCKLEPWCWCSVNKVSGTRLSVHPKLCSLPYRWMTSTLRTWVMMMLCEYCVKWSTSLGMLALSSLLHTSSLFLLPSSLFLLPLPPSPFLLPLPFSSLSLPPLSPFLLPLPSLTTLVTLYPPSHLSCLTLGYPLSPSLNVHIHYVKCTTDMAYCIMFTLFSVSLYCTCSPTHAVTILGLEHWLHTQPLFALSNLHVCIIRIRPCPLILPVPPVLLYAHASICAPITMITVAAYNLQMKGNCMKNRCTKRQWFWAAAIGLLG